MADPVTFTLDEQGLATITLDDGKANALSPSLIAAVHAALDRAEAAAATVVLTGRPGRFSGGFDLTILTGGGEGAVSLLRAGFELSHRILSYPRGVVMACSGHAIAMGAFLLLSGDHRIGISGGGHRICANEVALGMTMPHAAIEVCRLRLTPSALQQAVVLATPYDHDRAVAAGFLDEVVPEAELLSSARTAALRLHGLHAGALQATKLRLRASMLTAMKEAIDRDGRELLALMAR
jgi:enoyl-CoA hydratase